MRDIENILHERQTILDTVRGFFRKRGYVEVETPIVVPSPGMEPTLDPFETTIITTDGSEVPASLITSPEYAMKKLLGVGMERIFTITHVFRNREAWNGSHNPEFTILEWYRQGADYHMCMDETEALVESVAEAFGRTFTPVKRHTIAELFDQHLGIDILHADTSALVQACERAGVRTTTDDTRSDLFFRLFLEKIEPHISQGAHFVHGYPSYQAALAKINTETHAAERFELYIDGHELCNGFTELTDPEEQRRRFTQEQEARKMQEKTVFPIDETLLDALSHITDPTYGNALGIDRLHMIMTDAEQIEEVSPFSANTLFAR